jgi:phosphatidate cytidylyltransferase
VADAARRNLALRLLTAAVGVPIVFYLLYWAPAWAFPSVTAGMSVLASLELSAMVSARDRALSTFVAFGTLLLFAVVALPSVRAHASTVLVALTLSGFALGLAAPVPVERAAGRIAWALAGPLYVGGLFGTIADLFRHPYGGSWVLLALICGFLSDTAGYFVGQRYGKRPLHPISPKKTIEGAIAGMLGGVAGGVVAHFTILPVLPLGRMVVVATVATALGQLGDLCESLIKRSVGVKDSGTLLPGHGGVLDRSDAMLFSAAAVWIYVTHVQ